MAKVRIAFLGFRHGHINSLYASAKQHARCEVVAACEEDPAAAKGIRDAGIELTHAGFDEIFEKVQFDAVAIGDYFGRRGSIIIRALQASKHVIADKPICTRITEIDTIARLSREKNRAIGAMLDMRDHGGYRAMRRLIRGGAIGTVHTVNFTAQHPLNYGKRPAWYFEEGKHGGTINDIGIHAIDLIPWLTKRKIVEAVAAREWNARKAISPWFKDAGQIMLRLDNDGGVLGDVSYLTPDPIGYTPPQYWRVTCHGETGIIETNYNARTVELATTATQSIPNDPNDSTGCLDAFLDDIEGKRSEDRLSTADVLDATRRALLIQQAADERKTRVMLG
jgi:predicted dehydrogenase